MAIRFWLGVAHRDHVLRGVHMGVCQSPPRAQRVLHDMNEADGVVYYSPKTRHDGDALREFTALGRIAPGPAFQSGDSSTDFRAWRRRTDYDPVLEPTAIRPLLTILDLSRGNPDWGYQLRAGLLEISRHDFDVIRHQMRRPNADIR
ncbi:MAG: EVE domain-containing protein [Cryobacterium sp.]